VKPTVISLFSGIGGIDLAFSTAGFNIIAQVEIDLFCRKVLNKHAPTHWPNAKQFTDVNHFGVGDISYADIIVGGFPCQDISVANSSGRGLEGERSGLWSQFTRIIGEIRPRAVLLENVPNVTIRGGVRVIADLAAMGYVGRWGVISASDAGASHRRERWWCVAYANSIGLAEPTSAKQSDNPQHGADTTPFSRLHLRHDSTTVRDGEVLVNTDGIGLGKRKAKHAPETGFNAKPRLGGADDGLSGGLDKPRFPAGPHQPQHSWEAPRLAISHRDRKNRIKSLGNAVVPQVVYWIAVNMLKTITAPETA